MAPPAIAALALLGVWILLVFWTTTTAGRSQARATDRLAAEEQSDRSLEESSSSFSAADD